VNQSIVHSFTTVMHEVGAHIGFIVSKRGLQSGAREYIRNTNIEGMTYAQFRRDELLTIIHTATDEFNLIFGRNIFA
jgi:hypothetical protein